jgi:hypothetical protein
MQLVDRLCRSSGQGIGECYHVVKQRIVKEKDRKGGELL